MYLKQHNKNKITLTGASGFLGENFRAYLKDYDFSILLTQNLLQEDPNPLIEGKAVVHFAGTKEGKTIVNEDEHYAINYNLTKKLYNSFLSSSASKFIFISSVKAVSSNINGPLTEEFVSDPQTDYGKSKLLAEQYIQQIALPVNKYYYILRPCMIHGPGNDGSFNTLYKFVSKHIPYPLASFKNRRSFLSVENLCFAIKEILEKDNIPSGIYNIADDESLSVIEVVQAIADELNIKPRFLFVPKSMVRFFAKIGDIIKSPFNSTTLKKLTDDYIVLNNKLKNALGISNLPVSARQGLKKTINSFQSNVHR